MNSKADDINSIFADSNCLTPEQLTAYAEGNISPDALQIVERHLIDCPLCSDALEGIALMADPSELPEIITDLQQKIATAAQAPSEKKKIFFLNRQWLAAAAIVLVILTIGILSTLNFMSDNSEEVFVENYEKYPDKVTEELEDKHAEYSADTTVIGTDEDQPVEKENLEKSTVSNVSQSADDIPDIIDIPVVEDAPLDEEVAEELELSEEPESIETDMVGPTPSEQKTVLSKPEVKDGRTADPVANQTGTGNVATSTDDSTRTLAKIKSAENTDFTNGYIIKENKSQATFNETVQPAGSFTPMFDSNAPVSQLEEINISAPVPAGSNSYQWTTQFNMEETLLQAMQLYDENKFNDAIPLFNQVIGYDPLNDDALFYKAVSLIELNRTLEAIPLFDQVLSGNTPEYFEASQWYKSLALVKLQRTKEARTLLQEIVEKNGAYSSKARKVLQDIK